MWQKYIYLANVRKATLKTLKFTDYKKITLKQTHSFDVNWSKKGLSALSDMKSIYNKNNTSINFTNYFPIN